MNDNKIIFGQDYLCGTMDKNKILYRNSYIEVKLLNYREYIIDRNILDDISVMKLLQENHNKDHNLSFQELDNKNIDKILSTISEDDNDILFCIDYDIFREYKQEFLEDHIAKDVKLKLTKHPKLVLINISSNYNNIPVSIEYFASIDGKYMKVDTTDYV